MIKITSKRSILKNMRKRNMMALEQLDFQKRGTRGNIMALEQLDYWEAQVRKTSQLETTALLGSTSKRYIISLIFF
jgi:hypothetical protein